MELTAELRQLQLKHLRPSTRKLLSRYLDPLADTYTSVGHLRDWRGAAEVAGMSAAQIREFLSTPESCTEQLLQWWQTRQGSIVEQLLDVLDQLGRRDLLNDARLYERIKSDYQAHKLERPEPLPPLSEPIHPATHYDAFVSYCEKDENFVYNELVPRLEDKFGLKLCLNVRDLLAGGDLLEQTARIIAEKCRKVLLVFSPDYLDDEECNFQRRFAQSLSPSAKLQIMIPIIYRPLKPRSVPIEMNFIATVDFTNPHTVQWQWDKLRVSIANKTQIRSTDVKDLDTLQLKCPQDDHSARVPEQKAATAKSVRGQFYCPPERISLKDIPSLSCDSVSVELPVEPRTNSQLNQPFTYNQTQDLREYSACQKQVEPSTADIYNSDSSGEDLISLQLGDFQIHTETQESTRLIHYSDFKFQRSSTSSRETTESLQYPDININ